MKYKIIYLPIFRHDILQISEALTEYPNKAQRLFREMEKNLLMLTDMPYIYPEYQANPKYRRMVLEDHLLFYLIDEKKHLVKVYRLLYSKSDISKQV